MLNFTLPNTGFPVFVDGFVFPSYFHYYEYLRFHETYKPDVGAKICSILSYEDVIKYVNDNDVYGEHMLWKTEVGSFQDILNFKKAVSALLEQNSGLINSLTERGEVKVEPFLSALVLNRVGSLDVNGIWEEYRMNYLNWSFEAIYENF